MSNVIYTPFLGYLRIATGAHEKMVKYVNCTGRTCLDADEFPQSADGQATIVVVYTVIALECYIFNYAARRLGEGFCKKHVDSMNLHTKWLVVPKLVTDKGIPPDHNGIELLQKLIGARNSVIHAKAVNMQMDQWEEQRLKIIDRGKVTFNAAAGALNAFRCVGELGRALSVIDPQEPGAVLLAAFLETPKYSFSEKPSEA